MSVRTEGLWMISYRTKAIAISTQNPPKSDHFQITCKLAKLKALHHAGSVSSCICAYIMAISSCGFSVQNHYLGISPEQKAQKQAPCTWNNRQDCFLPVKNSAQSFSTSFQIPIMFLSRFWSLK
ncbi:hypothetical protein SAY86_019463 [Trapa natans]|uniref:Uncharacterized protein n=1 Tax=Trapa natans TaxID=22666 RepID=A0AAN7LP05_TRANT|nr:hypothetical protein SAY86_019463 [Trapa natans]